MFAPGIVGQPWSRFFGVFVGRSRPSATMDLVIICLESATCIPRLGAEPVEDCSVLATRARESGAVVHGVILKAPGKVIGRFWCAVGEDDAGVEGIRQRLHHVARIQLIQQRLIE